MHSPLRRALRRSRKRLRTQTQLLANTASPPDPQSETGTLARHSGKKTWKNFDDLMSRPRTPQGWDSPGTTSAGVALRFFGSKGTEGLDHPDCEEVIYESLTPFFGVELVECFERWGNRCDHLWKPIPSWPIDSCTTGARWIVHQQVCESCVDLCLTRQPYNCIIISSIGFLSCIVHRWYW